MRTLSAIFDEVQEMLMADTRLTHASVNDGCDTPSPRHFSCCSQSRHFSMPCFARCMQATDGLSSACANLQRLRCVLEDGRVQLGHILRDLDPVIVVFGRCHVVMQYECTENARACTSMHEHVQCEQGCALRRWHTTHTHTHTHTQSNTKTHRCFASPSESQLGRQRQVECGSCVGRHCVRLRACC